MVRGKSFGGWGTDGPHSTSTGGPKRPASEEIGAPAFTLYKLHGSINWLYSGSALVPGQTIYHSGLDDLWGGKLPPIPARTLRNSDKIPLIVPPVADKGTYFHHPLCLGYSMPHTDRTMQFFIWRNQPLVSVKFCLVDTQNTVQHFRSTLPDSAFDFDGQYIRPDDPIPSFVERLLA